MTMGLTLLLAICVVVVCGQESPEKVNTYKSLYNWGIDSYSGERWYECKAFMKLALQDYKHHKSIIIHCHKKCDKKLTSVSQVTPVVSELGLFDVIMKRGLCLQRCKTEAFTTRPQIRVDYETEVAFDTLMPYSFVQLCYWKMNDLKHAVQAAYTYLTRNPNDSMMSKNLDFYRNHKNFSEDFLVDLEQMQHQKLYMDGVDAYEREDYLQVIDKMERSLEAFWEAEAECRVMCNTRLPVLNMETDLYVHVSKHYVHVLQCQAGCPAKMGKIRGNNLPDFLPSHFHYLQYSYWQDQRVQKACEAAATYLVFFPDDDVMFDNIRYFSTQFKLNDAMFQPRPQVLSYYRRQLSEAKQLEFIEEKFPAEDWTEEFPNTEHDFDYKPINEELTDFEARFSSISKNIEYVLEENYENEEAIRNEESSNLGPPQPTVSEENNKVDDADKNDKKFETKDLKKSSDGIGTLVVKENIIGQEQCKLLLNIPNSATEESLTVKDGELVQILTTKDVVEMVESNKLSLEAGKLFLDQSEIVRDQLVKLYNIPFYITNTEIICRIRKSGEEDEMMEGLEEQTENDLCLSSSIDCSKWNGFAGLLYLTKENDDLKNTKDLAPACGKLVILNNETPNMQKVDSGSLRCALVVLMEKEGASTSKENERVDAQQRIAQHELTIN